MDRRRAFVVCVAYALFVGGACTRDYAAGDGSANDGGVDGGAGAPNDASASGDVAALSDAGADAASLCAGDGGPLGVRVGDYCIDATEVTNAEYAQFLAAKGGDASGQPAFCAWNASYTPSCDPFTPTFSQPGFDRFPVQCVDWCDAYAYCQWAGKRLCGQIGGGPTPFALASDPTIDQWYRACSAAGAHPYPYGDDYDALACNGADSAKPSTVVTGSLATCVGGYPGIFDMSGNVSEWTDSCFSQAGSADICMTRGGDTGSTSDAGFLRCDLSQQPRRNYAEPDTGIRCCAP